MSEVSVVGEVSLAQRLALGSKNAIDLTPNDRATDEKSLRNLRGDLLSVSTPEEGIPIVKQLTALIRRSQFCLLSPKGVGRLQRILDGEKLLNVELTNALIAVKKLCRSKINVLQEQHRELGKKSIALELAKTNLTKQEDDINKMIAKAEKKTAAAEKKIILAQKRYDAAKKNLNAIKKAVKDTKKESKKLKGDLVKHKKKICSC